MPFWAEPAPAEQRLSQAPSRRPGWRWESAWAAAARSVPPPPRAARYRHRSAQEALQPAPARPSASYRRRKLSPWAGRVRRPARRPRAPGSAPAGKNGAAGLIAGRGQDQLGRTNRRHRRAGNGGEEVEVGRPSRRHWAERLRPEGAMRRDRRSVADDVGLLERRDNIRFGRRRGRGGAGVGRTGRQVALGRRDGVGPGDETLRFRGGRRFGRAGIGGARRQAALGLRHRFGPGVGDLDLRLAGSAAASAAGVAGRRRRRLLSACLLRVVRAAACARTARRKSPRRRPRPAPGRRAPRSRPAPARSRASAGRRRG